MATKTITVIKEITFTPEEQGGTYGAEIPTFSPTYPTLNFTFDGVEYNAVPRSKMNEHVYAYTAQNVPFRVMTDGVLPAQIVTASGQHTIKATAEVEIVLKKVIALQTFTYADNTVSMYKGEVAEIDADIADELIADGFVKEYGGDTGIMVVEVGENNVLNHSYEEIVEHVANGGYVYCNVDGTIYNLHGIYADDEEIEFLNISLSAVDADGTVTFEYVSVENGEMTATIASKNFSVTLG
jgi:hypothetical protein